jgi:hypothetical protein
VVTATLSGKDMTVTTTSSTLSRQTTHPSPHPIASGADVHRERWALKQEVGNVGERALLLTLAVHAHDSTLATWLGSELLTRELACTRNSVTNYTNGLAGRGLVATVPLFRRNGRGQSATLFVLNVNGWLDDALTIIDIVILCNTRASVMAGIPNTVELPPQNLKLGHEGANGVRLPSLR